MGLEELAELIRKFNPKNSNGCYYCGSHINFDEDSDDVELLAKAIFQEMKARE